MNVLANNPPVITDGANQTLNDIKTNVSVQLNGTATDPDNAAPSASHVLTYRGPRSTRTVTRSQRSTPHT